MRRQDTFRVDFVVVEPRSGATDNNGGADFALPLLGAPSEAEIAARRAAAAEDAERERLAVRGPPPGSARLALRPRRGPCAPRVAAARVLIRSSVG